MQSHLELLVPILVTKLSQHLLILGKLWIQKHNVIINMSYDKNTFWSGHCQHLTIKTELQGIALAPNSQSKPMGDRKKILVQESGRIVLPSSPKKNFGEVLADWDIFHTNFSITKLKEGVTPGMKILKKEPNAKTKQKKTVLTKKLPKFAATCAAECT